MIIAKVLEKNDSVLSDKMIRLIGPENNKLGIVKFTDAFALAEKYGYDLVLVADNTEPPVCKIIEYNKKMYSSRRKQRENLKKQKAHSQKLKEIKFHPNIDKHDFDVKVNHITNFLKKGHQVKISLLLRGREMTNVEHAMDIMKNVITETTSVGTADSKPRLQGRSIGVMISPQSQNKK